MGFLRSIKLSGLLSFPPDSAAIPLTPLNVLIGPNGSGKSNLIEAIELLRSTPTALAAAVREGGTAVEWLWKGMPSANFAALEVVVEGHSVPDLRYGLSFVPSQQRMEIVDEVIEESQKRYASEQDVYFFYRYQHGRPVINIRQTATTTTPPPLTSTTTARTGLSSTNARQPGPRRIGSFAAKGS